MYWTWQRTRASEVYHVVKIPSRSSVSKERMVLQLLHVVQSDDVDNTCK